jgi:hypothetical protein
VNTAKASRTAAKPTSLAQSSNFLTVMPATAGLLLSFAWLAWPAQRQKAEM